MENKPTRVMLVDDHAIVRSGFRRLLEESPHLRVVAEAASAEQAYRRFVECSPDVIVLDISMPGTSGLEFLRRLLGRSANARVIVFSMHEDPAMAERALESGACGYVSKSNAPEVLMLAIDEVAAGRQFLSADVTQALAVSRQAPPDDPVQQLSGREFEIFLQLVGGRAPNDIARALNLSEKTIANYHSQIKQKLGVGSDIELVRLALRQNLLPQ